MGLIQAVGITDNGRVLGNYLCYGYGVGYTCPPQDYVSQLALGFVSVDESEVSEGFSVLFGYLDLVPAPQNLRI